MQVYRHLKKQIEQERFGEGDYLPAEKALAGTFGVSAGTINKALSRLQEEGYVERRTGHGTHVTFSANPEQVRDEEAICVLLGTVTESFWAEIYGGVFGELQERSYKPLLIERDESYEVEEEAIRRYRDRVGGFIIAPTREMENRALYGDLMARGIPFVFIDRYLPELNVDAVVCDNEAGGYSATRHLLELGHRRIAVVGDADAISVRHRIAGYRKALDEWDVAVEEDLIFRMDRGAFEHGYAVGTRIVEEHPDVTAALGLRDDAAWGCLDGVLQAGKEVPEEFSVVGYGDDPAICGRLNPTLTTVRLPKRRMGSEAARKLIRKLEKRSERGAEVLSLSIELIERESTGPVPEDRRVP
jgi:DNA-binding LacI/PurR family transcriptional regulator